MSIVSSVVLYFLLWWTVIFITLPFGVKPPSEHTLGHMGGAPAGHNLKKKVFITTIVSFILWLGLNPLLHWELNHLREEARKMAIEDEKK